MDTETQEMLIAQLRQKVEETWTGNQDAKGFREPLASS